MASKAIIGGGIAVVAIIFVIFVVSSGTISNVSPVAEKELIPSNDPVDVIDFTAVQFGDVITLDMTIGAAMPDTIDEMSLSESATGFGYGWFGGTRPGGGHLEGEGEGHLIGYIVKITEDEPEWKADPVRLDLVLVSRSIYGEACISIQKFPADFSVDDNIITLTNGPDNRPYVNAFFVDRIVSFEIIPNINNWCHENQYFMKMLDIYKSE